MKSRLEFDYVFNNHNESSYFNKHRSILSTKIFDSSLDSVPKLTICIPTFKRPERIFRLLDLFSSYGLIFDDFLFLICDNNPSNITNKTSIISSLSKYKLQIRYYINELNIGMFENWNRAIYLSTTKWVTLLHDDDLLNINFFLSYEFYIKKFSKYNIIMNSFVITNIKNLDYTSLYKVKTSNFKYQLLKPFDNIVVGSNIYSAPSCGVLIKKSFFESNGGFINNDYFFPANDHFSLYYFNLKSTLIKLDVCFGYYILEDNLSLDKSISVSSAVLNYKFRMYLSNIYIKNKILSKFLLEGTNNNLQIMINNGPLFYDFKDIDELKNLKIRLPNKINLFLYKLLLKIYKIIKSFHFY
jgi:hypothetical protein